MDKARSSFSIDNGVWRCWREGALIFVCVLGGFGKSVKSRGERKIWL